jgi:hypothetical protein
MNARFLSMFRVGLTVTAVTLCGAMVLSTGTGCGSSNGGGTGNNTSTGGTGGTGGAGGEGGGGGSTGGAGSTGCADPAANSVNFCDGKAQGAMQGYSYVSLGVLDGISTPVCAEDPNDLTKTRPITAPDVGKCEQEGKTCPRTGHTVWSSPDKLCITGGKIPKVVTPSGATSPDYKSAWGLQIGVNTGDPPAADGGKTLGEIVSDASSLQTITLATEGSVTPTGAAVRVVIHLKSMGCTWNPYCSTWSASGNTLASFNTQCWNGSKCGSTTKSCFSCADDAACLDNCCDVLKAEDIPNIDKIGIQISADTGKEYSTDSFCLTGITFGK